MRQENLEKTLVRQEEKPVQMVETTTAEEEAAEEPESPYRKWTTMIPFILHTQLQRFLLIVEAWGVSETDMITRQTLTITVSQEAPTRPLIPNLL